MKNYYLLSQTKIQYIMAKNFPINQSLTGGCYDRCNYKNNGIHIGSYSCQSCINYIDGSKDTVTNSPWISCPKIIYRSQITGRVIMRKHS